MVLKVFRDRRHESGWYYLGGVRAVQVDRSTWVIARETRGEEDARADYMICGVQETSRGIADRKPDRGHTLHDYHLMMDWSVVEDFTHDDETLRVVVITAELESGGFETYVLQEDRSSWLLSNEGKTVERLN